MQSQGTDPRRVFGQYLRTERELRQIPLSEVAAATKIPLHTLENLEAGGWSELPAEVFVRGFVRSYARHVGLLEQEACRRYHEAVQETAPAQRTISGDSDEEPEETEEPEEIVARPEHSSRRRFEFALLVIIVLIIATITLSLLWWRGDNGDIQASASPPAAPAVQRSASTFG